MTATTDGSAGATRPRTAPAAEADDTTSTPRPAGDPALPPAPRDLGPARGGTAGDPHPTSPGSAARPGAACGTGTARPPRRPPGATSRQPPPTARTGPRATGPARNPLATGPPGA